MCLSTKVVVSGLACFCLLCGSGAAAADDERATPPAAEKAEAAPTDRYGGFRPQAGEFRYVGAWRGRKKGSRRIGRGTCLLISPSWVATAAHVARPKAADPDNRTITVKFPGGVSRRVDRAHPCPSGDFAIAHLDAPVTEIAPVRLLGRLIAREEGVFVFTLVGMTSGLHAVPGHRGFADGRNESLLGGSVPPRNSISRGARPHRYSVSRHRAVKTCWRQSMDPRTTTSFSTKKHAATGLTTGT